MLPESVRFLERDWLSANHVLMTDGADATIVDTGYSSHSRFTCELIANTLQSAESEKPLRLTRIINSHLHADHCGGNAALSAQWHCDIIIPESCRQAVEQWTGLTHQHLAQRCDHFSFTGTLNCGDHFIAGGIRWNAHATAGHDPDSLVFYAPQIRTLISADALWEHGFGLIFPELAGEPGFDEQGEALDLIESLNPAIIIPGHGPIFTNLQRALDEARSRLAAYKADPLRNSRTALKVLIKFLLLEHQRISSDQLIEEAERASVICSAADMLGMSLADAVHWAIGELNNAGQLTYDGNTVANAD